MQPVKTKTAKPHFMSRNGKLPHADTWLNCGIILEKNVRRIKGRWKDNTVCLHKNEDGQPTQSFTTAQPTVPTQGRHSGRKFGTILTPLPFLTQPGTPLYSRVRVSPRGGLLYCMTPALKTQDVNKEFSDLQIS